jgi:putative flippase GtrA
MIHEVAKFGIVGILAFAITLGGTWLLNEGMGLSPTVATTIATIIATVFSYIGNRNWAFKHRRGEKLGREGLLFIIFNAVGLLIQVGAVAFVQHVLGYHRGLPVYIGLVAGVGIGTVARLYFYHRWVFNSAPVESLAAEELAQPASSRALPAGQAERSAPAAPEPRSGNRRPASGPAHAPGVPWPASGRPADRHT